MPIANSTRAVLFSITSLVAAPAFAQGEECVGVENDIARLQCFDAAFASSGGGVRTQALTTDEAFGELLELVRYQTPDFYLGLSGFQENMCALQIQTRSFSASYKGYKGGKINIWRVDLRNVESIARWGPQGPVLNFERNSGGVAQSFVYRIPNATTLPELINYKPAQSSENSNRSISIYLVVPEYKPDYSKIQVAFENFWNTCRS
jgi:hypothetical protein